MTEATYSAVQWPPYDIIIHLLCEIQVGELCLLGKGNVFQPVQQFILTSSLVNYEHNNKRPLLRDTLSKIRKLTSMLVLSSTESPTKSMHAHTVWVSMKPGMINSPSFKYTTWLVAKPFWLSVPSSWFSLTQSSIQSMFPVEPISIKHIGKAFHVLESTGVMTAPYNIVTEPDMGVGNKA